MINMRHAHLSQGVRPPAQVCDTHPMGPEYQRTPDRGYKVAFRMSLEDRNELRRRAEARGISVQSYLEHLVFGREAQDRNPGPHRPDQQELPLNKTA